MFLRCFKSIALQQYLPAFPSAQGERLTGHLGPGPGRTGHFSSQGLSWPDGADPGCGVAHPPSRTGALALLCPTCGLPGPRPSLSSRTGRAPGLGLLCCTGGSSASLLSPPEPGDGQRGCVCFRQAPRDLGQRCPSSGSSCTADVCQRGVQGERRGVSHLWPPHGRPRGNPSSSVSALPPWRTRHCGCQRGLGAGPREPGAEPGAPSEHGALLGASPLVTPFLPSSERLPPGALPPGHVEAPFLPPPPRASLPGSFGLTTS